jgi:hypothetical protein
MTTKMLDAQWSADPTQPGRIAAGEAIAIDVRVAFWRVPGGDSEVMRLVKETEALCVAAPVMAKALLGIIACAHADGETICARCLRDARSALALAGIEFP